MAGQRVRNISDELSRMFRFFDDRDPVDERITFGGFIERRQYPHCCRFARAVRSDKTDDVARRERERDIIHRASIPKMFFKVGYLNLHRPAPSLFRTPTPRISFV